LPWGCDCVPRVMSPAPREILEVHLIRFVHYTPFLVEKNEGFGTNRISEIR
jgi:hypothetical protein